MKQDEVLEQLLHVEEPAPTFGMNPKKFMLWLFIVSIVMIFASLTSAYIVKQADSAWLSIELPTVLWYSTAVLLLSSFTAHIAYRAGKAGNAKRAGAFLLATLALGLLFLGMQWMGWVDLVQRGIFFGGVDYEGNPANPAGSFIYVLMGVHAVHLIAGLIYWLVVILMKRQTKAQQENWQLHLELSTIFWHFLDGLWVYLFLFLLLNR